MKQRPFFVFFVIKGGLIASKTIWPPYLFPFTSHRLQKKETNTGTLKSIKMPCRIAIGIISLPE